MGLESSIPTDTQRACEESVLRICAGNLEAYSFWRMVQGLVVMWDHLVDGDAMDLPAADRAIQDVLLELPLNEWFIANRASLLPVISNAVSAWRHSNEPAAPKIKAFDIYTELACTIAYLLGGQELISREIPTLRRLQTKNQIEDDLKDGGTK